MATILDRLNAIAASLDAIVAAKADDPAVDAALTKIEADVASLAPAPAADPAPLDTNPVEGAPPDPTADPSAPVA